MNKLIFTTALFCFLSLRLSAQTPILEDITVPFDTFKFAQKRGFNFVKYRQYDSLLLGFDIRNDVYKSTDFGKTWTFFFPFGDSTFLLNSKQIRILKKVSPNNGDNPAFNTTIQGSDDFGKTYKVLNTSIFDLNDGSTLDVSRLNLPPKAQDSILFFIAYNTKGLYYSLNGGVTFNFFSTKGDFFPIWTLRFDYACNNFYVINGEMFKSPNFVHYKNIDSLFYQYSFSMASKKDTDYVYLTDLNKTKVKISHDIGLNWTEKTFPFTLYNPLGESSIYQNGKYYYALAKEGIFRSEDPLFSTYTKIKEGRLPQKTAFSILPSGIYMNGLLNEVLRSTNNGDTWQVMDEGVFDSNFSGLVNFKDSIWFSTSNQQLVNPLDFKSYRLYENKDEPVYFSSNVNTHKIDDDIFFENNRYRYNTTTKKFFPMSEIIYAFEGNKIASFNRLQNGKNSIEVSLDKGNTFKHFILPFNNTWIENIRFHKGRLLIYYIDNDKNKNNYILAISNSDDYSQPFEKIAIGNCYINKILSDTSAITIFTPCGIFESVDIGKTWIQFAQFPEDYYFNVIKHKEYYIFTLNQKDYALFTNDKGVTWRRIKNFPQKYMSIAGKYLYAFYQTPNIIYFEDGYVEPKNIDKALYRTPLDSILKYAPLLDDYGLLTGQIATDENGNCKKDTLENGIAEKILKIEPGGFTAITDKNGRFALALSPNIYTLSTTKVHFNPVCGDTVLKNLQIKGNQTLDTVILFKPIPNVNDLALSLTSETRTRPGFEVSFNVKVENLGTVKADSAVVTFRFPTAFASFVSADQNGVFQNGQVTWNLKNIAVDENRQFKVRLKINPTTPLSTNLSFTGKVTILNKNDTLPQNNEDVATLRVTGSFDPNDKTVLPEGKIPFFTNELDYLIRFQNTGTDTAFKVVVVDTLPSNVDVFTMKTVSASHPYSVSLKKNIVSFTFDNILLVDSLKNEKLSHGFVRFKVGMKQGAKVGDSIYNKAAIYFDFNKPIITNTAKTNLIKPILTISRSVNVCKGAQYKGITYNATTLVSESVLGALYDTTYLTTVDVKPSYSIQKDTVLKPNELFEGRAVVNGETIIKALKTKEWGCDSLVSIRIQKLTPTNDLPAELSFMKIYPNPTKDYLSISYELKQAAWVEISLYNAMGQKVKILLKKVQNTEGGYQLQADVKELNSGTYRIEFQTEKGVYYQRFVKI